MQFMDHYMPGMEVLDPRPPLAPGTGLWSADSGTGALAFRCAGSGGLEYGGAARPWDDHVDLEFSALNRCAEAVHGVQPNHCLTLGGSPDFAARWDLDRLLFPYQGSLVPMSQTSPTPAAKGRKPWLLFISPAGRRPLPYGDDAGSWWLVDQDASDNVLAVESADGRLLLAYAWDRPDETLMSNCGNPCLHAGGGASPRLEPGESFTWRGRIWLIPSDRAAFMRRYRAERASGFGPEPVVDEAAASLYKR
jgi:hypothetical protein